VNRLNAINTKWSKEDETTLLELVDNYETKGKSKQQAFEMVANIINRSKAACAARYQLLKKKQVNSHGIENEVLQLNSPQNHSSLTLEIVIDFLINHEQNGQFNDNNKILKNKLKNLKEENNELNNRINNLKATIQKNHDLLKRLV
jgi:prespore-specific regulator